MTRTISWTKINKLEYLYNIQIFSDLKNYHI